MSPVRWLRYWLGVRLVMLATRILPASTYRDRMQFFLRALNADVIARADGKEPVIKWESECKTGG